MHGLGIPHRWSRRAAPLALLALLALGGCAAAPADGVEPTIAATLVGERPGRPPLTRLLVDLSIANTDTATRWVLIPTHLPVRVDTAGGVDHLELSIATVNGARVTVGRLLGRAGTYALRLAPGARVTLRRLEIGWWGEPPATAGDIAFEVRLAGAVTIDGQPLAAWFDGDPTIAGTVEIDLATAPRMHSRAAPGGRELPLGLSEVMPVGVRLASP